METNENKFYYKPVPDARTIEKATTRATYLIDHGYIQLTSGLTYEHLLENLIQLELRNNKATTNDL